MDQIDFEEGKNLVCLPLILNSLLLVITVKAPIHFHSLDALRGMAALGVVLFHWQHFFYNGVELSQFRPEIQPLYSVLQFSYIHGWRAVDLFFCLSGFIFYWLYSEKVAAGRVTFYNFLVLRFSRLYPLHFITLLLVTLGQFIVYKFRGGFFVVENNDWWYFFRHLFFISSWGPGETKSFNGPVWSVSVEVLLYIVFFFTVFLRLRRWWHLVLGVISGYLLVHSGWPLVGRGIFSFFLGGVSYYLYNYALARRFAQSTLLTLAILLGLMWVAIPLNFNHSVLFRLYREHLWWDGLNIAGKDFMGAALLMLQGVSFELILFPATIVIFALLEAWTGGLGKRIGFLGDISYSSYLLHFPLQMLFLELSIMWSLPRTVFCTTWMLVLFFAVLIAFSSWSYYFLERPCQSLLRKWMLKSRGSE